MKLLSSFSKHTLLFLLFSNGMSLGLLHAQDFSKLAGTWCSDEDPRMCETWVLEADGNLTGVGFKVKGNEKMTFEHLKLFNFEGQYFYLGKVKDQGGTLFSNVKGPEKTWIFSNPEHDFPKIIMYTWLAADTFQVSLFGEASRPTYQAKYTRTSFEEKNQPTMEKTPKATGIGGIFFKCENPDSMKSWYNENLGLNTDQYGTLFESRNAHNPEKKEYLQWSPMTDNTTYFEPSDKQFMINYRVQNIEKLVENLKAAGVTICDEIASYDYGKFVHIMDPEGNKIELWEPVDEVFEETPENKKSH